MKIFKSLTLDNVGPHVATTIDFRDGINIIRGDNFSGKSIVFQALTKLVCNELPYSATKRSREIFGTITCSAHDEKNRYEVQYIGRNNKFKISENGYMLDYRRGADAALKAGEIFPWTLDAWQNFCYLSNDSFPILMRGTPIMRRTVFEHLLPGDTREQYKSYQSRIRELNAMAVEHKTLVDVYSENNLEVDPSEIERYEKRLSEIQPKIKSMRAKRDARLKLNRLLRQVKSASHKFIAYGDWTLDHVTRNGKVLAEKIQEMDAKIDENINYELAWRAWNDYLARKKEFDATNAEWLKTGADLKRRFNDLKKSVKPFPKNLQNALLERPAEAQALASLKAVVKPVALADLDGEYSSLKATLIYLRESTILHKKCPTCASAINQNALIESVEKRIAGLKAKRAKSVDQDGAWREFCLERSRLENKSGIDYAMSQKYKSDILDSKWNCEIFAEMDNHGRDKPQEPKPIPEPEAKPDDSLREKKKEMIELQDAFRVRWAELTAPEVDDEELSRLENIALEIERKLSDLYARKTQGDDNRGKRKILSRALRERPMVEQLVKEYSPTGVRNDLLAQILEKFINDMNYYAPLVFPKRYRFDGKVKEKGVELTCDRGLGFSDIRRLSGAEGKLFTLISLLALRSLLPEEYLSNLLVLDEMEASMKGPIREKFVDLLPELQKQFPSIWIVTPLDAREFQIELNDCPIHEYRTIRKNNKSRLVTIR